jgi:site-specific recombinase XerD
MSIYETKTGWKIKVMRDGYDFRHFVLGLDQKPEAVAIELQAIADMSRGLRPDIKQLAKGTGLTLHFAYEATWEHRWKYETVGYQTKVTQYWNALTRFFIDEKRITKLTDIDTLLVDEYIRTLRDKGNKPKTINNKLTCLSSMIKHMVHQGRMKHPPFIEWEPVGDNSRMRYYSPAEEVEIIELARAFPFAYQKTNELLADFIILLFDTGMRPWREAHQLHCSWIKSDINGMPVIRIPKEYSKTKKPRDVPMTDRVKRVLSKRVTGQLIDFQPFIKLDYKYHCTRFWNESVRPTMQWADEEVWYGMRHTFATRLVSAKVQMKVIQKLMGHAKITQTAKYTKVTDEALQSGIAALQGKDNSRDKVSPNALPNDILPALSA